MSRPPSHRLLAAVVLPALVGVGAVVTAAPAAADQGLAVGAESRYVVDPQDEVVHATMTIDLRNTSPDRREGSYVYYTYFDSFAVPVPAGAERVRASSNGGSLTVSTSSTKDPSTALAVVGFPRLRYGNDRRITMTFDVPGAKHRSEDTTRVGPGYATFAAVGPGDPGRTSVEIVAPASWEFTSTADGFDPSTKGSSTTYTLDEAADEYGIWSIVSVRDRDDVAQATVKVRDDLTVSLSAFSDDPKWTSFVTDVMTEGVPTLERLVGEPWPGGLATIREDSSPSLLGYDGWFDSSGDEIVVGERLDDDLMFHELSHAWIGHNTFTERWLYEGLAQVTAERAVEATGGSAMTHDEVSRSDDLAVALNSWGESATARSADVDGYAYPAAYRVMSDLLGDLDDEEYAAVLGAAVRGESAYDRPGERSTASLARTTWSSWLDLVETRAGVEGADVVSHWVLTGEQKKELPVRAKARALYDELDAADGAWLPPQGLRTAMTMWNFGAAADVREIVGDLGPAAVGVQDAGVATGLPVPVTVQEAYEDADSGPEYEALPATLADATEAITVVGAARTVRDAERDPFTALGARVLGVDARADRALAALDAGELDRARVAAGEVDDRSGWLLPLGLALPVLGLLVVAASGVLGRVALRRARAGRAAASGPDEDAGPPVPDPADGPAVLVDDGPVTPTP